MTSVQDVSVQLSNVDDASRQPMMDNETPKMDNSLLETAINCPQSREVLLPVSFTHNNLSLHIPPEIVEQVFHRALPPFLPDPAIDDGQPDSTWRDILSLKKSLVGICKTWYNVGLPFLYEDICTHRVEQLAVLVRTVTQAPIKFGQLIKVLHIHFDVFPKLDEDLTQDLNTLLQLCPNLSTIGYGSSQTFPKGILLPPLSTSITYARFQNTIPYDTLMIALRQTNASLQSLWIELPDMNDGDLQAFSAPGINTVVLPSLKSLYLRPNSYSDGRDLRLLSSHWDFPRLQNCTVIYPGASRIKQGLVFGMFAFLSKHARNFKFLHLHFDSFGRAFTLELRQRLSGLCPHLERLVVPQEFFTICAWGGYPLIMPELRWMEFWETSTLEGAEVRSKLLRICIRPYQLPALQGIRTISSDIPFCAAFKCLERYPPDFFTGLSENPPLVFELFLDQLEIGVNHVSFVDLRPPLGDLSCEASESEDSFQGRQLRSRTRRG